MEAADELAVGALKGDLGVDVQETSEIDCGEEQVAEFFFGFGGGPVLKGVLELGRFFANLGEDAGGVCPVKAGAGGLFCELQALERSGNRLGDAVERGNRPAKRSKGMKCIQSFLKLILN